MMRRFSIVFLAVSLAIGTYSAAEQKSSIDDVLKTAEEKIAAAVATIEQKPGNLYFSRTNSTYVKQYDLAYDRMESIRNLLKLDDFGPVVYDRILELAVEILVEAPDTTIAKTYHWNIHAYFLIRGMTREAGEALITYVHKYGDETYVRHAAFEKLAKLHAEDKEWDLALYYAENFLAFEPDSPGMLQTKARALMNLGFNSDRKGAPGDAGPPCRRAADRS